MIVFIGVYSNIIFIDQDIGNQQVYDRSKTKIRLENLFNYNLQNMRKVYNDSVEVKDGQITFQNEKIYQEQSQASTTEGQSRTPQNHKTKTILKKPLLEKRNSAPRQDNNSMKVINPIVTVIWKEILGKKGKVYFQNTISNNEDQFKSLKSNRKYFLAWLPYLENEGLTILQQSFQRFKIQVEASKIQLANSQNKLQQLNLALEVFELYLKGDYQKCVRRYYREDEGELRQKHNLEAALKFMGDEKHKIKQKTQGNC